MTDAGLRFSRGVPSHLVRTTAAWGRGIETDAAKRVAARSRQGIIDEYPLTARSTVRGQSAGEASSSACLGVPI